jgi:uncharacterized protein
VIARPGWEKRSPTTTVKERERRAGELAARLLPGIPDDPRERSDEQTRSLAACHLLDWHRREDKSKWWEFFRLADMPDDGLAG